MTQKMSWLDEEAMARRVFPLGVSTKSESYTFTIKTALGATFGVVKAIRVQDIVLQKWFNWDKPGPWTPYPTVTPGIKALYISFWAVNNGMEGPLTLTIKDDTGAVLATKTHPVAPYGGAGVGIEWTGDMPARDYTVSLTVTP